MMKQVTIGLLFASIITLVFTRYVERRQADEYLNKIHRELIYGRRS